MQDQAVLSSVSFEQFYQTMGFTRYPFRDRTAEKEDVTKLFIKPLDYSRLCDDLSSQQSVVVCGNRGSGKTITLLDLEQQVDKNRLCCLIDNFEDVKLENNQLDFYSLILRSLTKSLLIYISNNYKSIKRAPHDDKILLSFLIKKYGDSITDSQLRSQLEGVQLSWIKRLINRISIPLTTFINYGATAVTNFGNELLTKHFGAYLPDVSEENIKTVFPNIQFPVDNQFKDIPISYSLLTRSLEMIVRITKTIPIVLIDKLDEDLRLENDSDLVSAFCRDLICDNTLLLNQNIQLVISMWEIPFQSLSTIFRASKTSVYSFQWTKSQLEVVLNHRLSILHNSNVGIVIVRFPPVNHNISRLR